jgi:hypothetical protein
MLIGGNPDPKIDFSSEEFMLAIQNYFGVPMPACLQVLGEVIPTNHPTDKGNRVDAFGRNIATTRMNGGGAQYVHSSVQREIEGMLNRSGIRTKSGVGVFKDVVAQDDPEKAKQVILVDIVVVTGNLSSNNAAKARFGSSASLTDVKSCAPKSNYLPNTVNHRQDSVDHEYRRRARAEDRKLGYQQGEVGPVETRLKEYGVNGRVLGLVIGGYGEFSSDVYNLVELAVGQRTIEHAQHFAGDKDKTRAMFRTHLYRRLSFTGHRAWARMRLDRLKLVWAEIIPGYGEREYNRKDEELSMMEEFVFLHPENFSTF